MSWVTDNWIPLTVVGGLVGVSWYAGKHFDESESYNADEGIQVPEGYNEWWDELDNIRSQYRPDNFFNRRLGNPKWEDGILQQMFKDGWTPKQALSSWKHYNGAVGHFKRPPLIQATTKICKNCGEQGHNSRSCTNERVREIKYANDKSTRLKLSRKINALFKLGEGEQNTMRYINYGLGALAAGRGWDSPKMDFPIHFEHHGHPYVDNSGKWKLVEKHWRDIQDMRDDLGVDDFKGMIDTTKWEIGQPNWNTYMAESYNASTKKTKPRKTPRIKSMIEISPNLPITSSYHPDSPMVGHIEQKCSSSVCDEMVLTHDRMIGKRCLKCYYQNWEDLYDIGATDTPPPVDMSIPYDVRYKRNTPAEIAEREQRSIALQKQGRDANRIKHEQIANRPKTPLWSQKKKNILGGSWEDIQNDRAWDNQYAQIMEDKNKMSDKGWRKKYGLKSESYNADEGLWNDASKEQRLKWLKDAIPSIGDKYADYTWRELTPRLQEEMADESYDAETFAAYVSKSDTQRVRQLLKQEFPNLKFSVVKDGGRMSVSIMAGDIDFSDINDDVPRTKRYWERWGNPKPVFDGKLDINQYHLDGYNPKYTPLFEKIVSIMKGEDWFDHSDSQTDYFHTAYYIDLNIGKWNKPYEYKPNLKRGTRPTLESLVYKQGYGDDALTGLKGAYDEETFEASAVARNKAKTPVEKVLLHEELMNQAARNEMITKLTYDLAMRKGVHRQPMRTLKEAEYDSKLKKEFGDD